MVTKGFGDGRVKPLKAGVFCIYMNPKAGFIAFVRVSQLVESLPKELRMTALSSHRVERIGKDIHILSNLFNK